MPQIIAISGSLRRRSSNTTLCARRERATADVEVVLYDGLGALPHFNPDLDPDLDTEGARFATVGDLRTLLIGADAIVISSPEYAHGVPVRSRICGLLVSTGELVDSQSRC